MATPPPPAPAPLTRFLTAAARAAALRRSTAAVFDAGLVVCAVLTAGAWIAGWTLRGDLVGPLALGTGIVAVTAWTAVTVRAAWRRYGRAERTAASVAAHAGPLGPITEAGQRDADRSLRHEILGAFELIDPTTQLGSPELAGAYVADVAARISHPRIEAALALPRPRWRARAVAAAFVGLATITCGLAPTAVGGLALLLAAHDGRPPAPPEPAWSSLTVELTYPAHTRRPARLVPNPSGALRVVAGTEVGLTLDAWRPAAAARAVLNYDPTEAVEAPPPEIVDLTALPPDTPQSPEGMRFSGSFTARGSGTWTVVLLDDPDDPDDEGRRSPAMPLLLEPDRAPEVELLPLPAAQREVSERQSVDIRFVARDDFGVASAALVYQMPDGTTHRLEAGTPRDLGRMWRQRFTWDLSAIPLKERSDVLYWVEVRDNDPGLGLVPLPDPPGKVTRSTTMTLVVRDDEAEHAANIVKLAELRDRAVDLLAARMTTTAFDDAPVDAAGFDVPLPVRASAARDLLSGGGELLAMLSMAIDAATMDTLTDERDVAVLTKVHGRLKALHDDELALHAAMPTGVARRDPDAALKALAPIGAHNGEEVTQLEDEIIRIDDLVDGQVVERLEALVARLEATQRKLVDLLEQLKAGDESARAQIEQLEQRRKEDLRRIAEARAMLREEVDSEFMNLDAFEALEAMKQQEQLSEMLRRGETDAALEAARGQLGEVQQLRDAVQDKLGQPGGEAPVLTEEERQRMELLRELSRLQDEEGSVRAQTKMLHEAYREGVKDQAAQDDVRDAAADRAKSLRKALEDINDARLGRDARRGLEDAQAALETLENAAEDDRSTALDLDDAARAAEDGLQRAVTGSEAKEREGKALRRAQKKAQSLRGKTKAPLPGASEVLDPAQQAQLEDLARRQAGLRTRAERLAESAASKQFPKEGRAAMRDTDAAMRGSADALEDDGTQQAIRSQNGAWSALQRAIDSLRQGPPPPPPSSSSADASTEAERDRSLRDALMDAMKESTPEGYDAPVKRYYEELLR
ncbi:MAG: hypothetical protein AAGA54_03990 [Myxococcota bacterium]